MFTIYSADVTGNPGNCSYPHKQVVLDEASLKAAVCHDYVCAEYRNSYRNGDNFIGSDCLPVDCDNDHSENPEDWITPEDVPQHFPGVTFAVHFSRFHMREKNGKAARPKFHVLFPIDYVTDPALYSDMKKLVNSIFPYFDTNALDAARFFFGTTAAEVALYPDRMNLTEFLEEDDFDSELPDGGFGQSTVIPEGSRNATMSRFAGRVIKKYGDTDEAYQAFLDEAAKCVPPLENGELNTIWHSAQRFFSRIREQAGYAVNFIECLCHTKGTWARQSFELIDWQEQIIRDIFGVLKPNGYRQFNTAYIEIPKKQGKSELAAAVALLLTCGDGEERAEVYGCAADRQQASIVFNVAADMVRMCPALSKRVKILDSQKRLIYQPTGSIYQVLSADVGNKHGFNTHGVVFDELHTQPNRKLFDVMTKGSGDARMQPLYFLITTAGNDTKSICYEIHQKAKDIIEGRKIDHTFYPVIYGADESDDWTDPKVWKKANPSLGITVGIDKVRAACESAKQNPGEENSFRQLRLNQWVKQAVRWMPMDKWDKCEFAVSEDDLEGRVCYGGLDLSSTTDITAFVLVFPPEDEDDKYIILPYFWIPEDNLDLRVRRDHVPYDVWERQGYLQTTEGNVVHYGYIEKFIESLGERFNIREIAFDRWGAVQMVQNLEGMGFTVVPFGQGFKDMSPPTKELMKLVLEQRIAHGGHPVLRWMMDNIFIRSDPAGNIKPDKEKSTEKIDGSVATIMALDRAIRCGNDNGESVYDRRGLLFL